MRSRVSIACRMCPWSDWGIHCLFVFLWQSATNFKRTVSIEQVSLLLINLNVCWKPCLQQRPFLNIYYLFTAIYIALCILIIVFLYLFLKLIWNNKGSLISDVTCNYVSADGGRDGLWWPALPGHWLSYTGCWLSLLVMYWLLCLGCCFCF